MPDPHDMSVVAGPHGSTDDHGGDHGHDDHGHAPGALGPIDWRMWTSARRASPVGLIVTAGFVGRDELLVQRLRRARRG